MHVGGGCGRVGGPSSVNTKTKITVQEHQKNVDRVNADRRTFRQAVQRGQAGVPAPADESQMRVGRHVPTLNLTNAKRYLPPNCILHHDTQYDRIRGFYHIGGKRPSHSCNLSFTQDVALRVVLVWCWEQHINFFPDAVCPWDFPYELTELGGGTGSASSR